MEILSHSIGFWAGLIAGLFILVHLPSCNKHWVNRLGPFSKFFTKHHEITLLLATVFALLHVGLSLVGLIFSIWI